jgi:hypothetical protein
VTRVLLSLWCMQVAESSYQLITISSKMSLGLGLACCGLFVTFERGKTSYKGTAYVLFIHLKVLQNGCTIEIAMRSSSFAFTSLPHAFLEGRPSLADFIESLSNLELFISFSGYSIRVCWPALLIRNELGTLPEPITTLPSGRNKGIISPPRYKIRTVSGKTIKKNLLFSQVLWRICLILSGDSRTLPCHISWPNELGYISLTSGTLAPAVRTPRC